MPLSESLLREAKEARDRVIELDYEADRARLSFQHTIRRLHAEGGTLRDIAEALGISHQRVHQIVEGAEGKVALKNARDAIACSFCGISRSESRRIVAGPNVYVCDRCIALASEVVRDGEAKANERVKLGPASDGQASCSFCGKKAHDGRSMAENANVRICRDCLGLCNDILMGEASP
jgi:hypothetical protein